MAGLSKEEIFEILNKINQEFPKTNIFSCHEFLRLKNVLDDFLNGYENEYKRKVILVLCSIGIFEANFKDDSERQISRIIDFLSSSELIQIICDVENNNEESENRITKNLLKIKERKGKEIFSIFKFSELKQEINTTSLNDFEKKCVLSLCAGNFFRDYFDSNNNLGKLKVNVEKISSLLKNTNFISVVIDFSNKKEIERKEALRQARKRLLERKILEFRVALIESALRTWSLIVRKKKVSIPVSSILLCFAVFMIFFVKNERFIPSPKSFEIKNDFALIDFDSMERNEKLRQRSPSGGDMRIEDFENESQKQQSAEFLDSKLSAEIKGLSFDGMFFTGRMKILFMEKSLTDSGIRNIGFKGTHALDKKEGE